ncbi:MAG: EamA/RhaT family transporter, partial [Gammaproteobacteria bacterium]|nr:EamA/RhaT family transporter [Gammaproteobacteria bacterium]
LLGAGIVIASGLYLIWHERRASLAPAQPSLEVAA